MNSSKKFLSFCIAFILMLAAAIGFLAKSQADEVPGGYYLKVVNKTDYPINVYASTEHHVVIPLLHPKEEKLVGPFERKLGAKESFVRFKSKRWDRPVTFKFKDHETIHSKKIVLDRKKKGRIRGKVTNIRVESVWRKFSKEKGYEVRVEEIGPQSLPNFALIWDKYVSAPFKRVTQGTSS